MPTTTIEKSYLDKSAELYQKAIEENAASPGILSQGGLYFMELGRLEESVVLLRRAVELNPNYAQAHLWLSQAYRYGGMLEASRFEAQLAFKLDPEIREYSTINTYIYLGEYDKFVESLPRWQINARTLFYSGLARYYMRDVSGAKRDLSKAYDMQPEHPHAQFARALLSALSSDKEEGLRDLRLFDTKYMADGEMLYKSAQVHAILGDKHSAISLLRQSVEHDFYCYRYFSEDPLLDSLRDDPQFSSLMQLAHARHEAFQHKFFQ
jgi:tetratricopeptide (TPR) repeat protein